MLPKRCPMLSFFKSSGPRVQPIAPAEAVARAARRESCSNISARRPSTSLARRAQKW